MSLIATLLESPGKTKSHSTVWAIYTTSKTTRLCETDSVHLGLQESCHPKEMQPLFVSQPTPLGNIDHYHTIEVNITDSSWLNWLQSTESMNQMLSR